MVRVCFEPVVSLAFFFLCIFPGIMIPIRLSNNLGVLTHLTRSNRFDDHNPWSFQTDISGINPYKYDSCLPIIEKKYIYIANHQKDVLTFFL